MLHVNTLHVHISSIIIPRSWNVTAQRAPSTQLFMHVCRAGEENAPTPDRQVSRSLFDKYLNEDLEAQHRELEDRKERRRGRKEGKARPLYTQEVEKAEVKRSKYFSQAIDGSFKPNLGVHGRGKPQWWALRVTVGREKQVCTALERKFMQLREERSDLQEIATWDLCRRIRTWNPKSKKMGNKLVRYDGGGWVLLQAIMDRDVATLLRGNVNVLGFHHREVYEGEEFPFPVSRELLEELESMWGEGAEDTPLPAEVVDMLGLQLEPPADFHKDQDESSVYDSGTGSGDMGWYSGDIEVDGLWEGKKRDKNRRTKDHQEKQRQTFSSYNENFVQDNDNENATGYVDAGLLSSEWDSWVWEDDASVTAENQRGAGVFEDEHQLEDRDMLDLESWWNVGTTQEEEKYMQEIDLQQWAEKEVDPREEKASSHRTVGSRVELISGPFKDFEGVLEESIDYFEPERKVRANIDVFGKQTSVQVSLRDVQFIDDE